MTNRFIDPFAIFFDQSTGVVGASWQLNFFVAGGANTRQDTFAVDDLSGSANANPVVADGAGLFPPIFLDPAQEYRVTLNKSVAESSVQVAEADPVSAGVVEGVVVQVRQDFVAVADQVNFTLTLFNIVPGSNNAQVYINGVLQAPVTNYTEVSSSLITFVVGLKAGDNVSVLSGQSVFSIATANSIRREVQDMIAAQTVIDFTVIDYVPGTNNLSVFINGDKKIITRDYTETSATRITFLTPFAGGEELEAVVGLRITSDTNVHDGQMLMNNPFFDGAALTTSASFSQVYATTFNNVTDVINAVIARVDLAAASVTTVDVRIVYGGYVNVTSTRVGEVYFTGSVVTSTVGAYEIIMAATATPIPAETNIPFVVEFSSSAATAVFMTSVAIQYEDR